MKLEDRSNRQCDICHMNMATEEPARIKQTVHDKCRQAKPRPRLKLSDRPNARTALQLARR